MALYDEAAAQLVQFAAASAPDLNNCPSAGKQSEHIDVAPLNDRPDHLHNARKQLVFQPRRLCGSGRGTKRTRLPLYYIFLSQLQALGDHMHFTLTCG